MRLLSARIRNYRIHEDLSVDFDPARTLIGGPNESGKSTLIEAIHRCLFLKATVTGEAQARMQSTRSPGHPEVEVRFEAGGKHYQVLKRFSGQSGTTRLTQVGGATWSGEEAQARLTDLLRVGEVGGGRGIEGRISEQWSHLWVWQGKSLDDPSEHLASQQADLLQQLQQAGGAVAMQSELDGRVASRFSQARGTLFTVGGSVKKHSELERAQTDYARAEVEVAAVAERVERLRHAAQEFEEATAAIERAARDGEELTRQRQEVDTKLACLGELRRLEEKQAAGVADAAEKLAALEAIEGSICDLGDSIEGIRKALEPRQETQRRLESAVSDARRDRSTAEQAYEEALETTRVAHRRRDLAAAFVSRLDKRARCDKLDGHLETVRGLERELAGIRSEIARLVPLEQADMDALQELESRAAQAASALSAMATEVEVIATDVPIRVGSTELVAGGRHTVSDSTELAVGDSVRLGIRPGGGGRLEEAREAVRTLREELQRRLDGYGLGSVAEASKMTTLRAELLSKERSTMAALGQWPAGLSGLTEERRVAGEELAAATAEVQRRMEQVPDVAEPSTTADAQGRLAREDEELRRVESEASGRKAELDALRLNLSEREAAFIEACSLIEEDEQRLAKYCSQLELLVGNHGGEETRGQALKEAREYKAKLEVELSETRTSIEAMQPDLLTADRERLLRADEQIESQRQDARSRRAGSQALLRSDGADDPAAALAQAQARLETAAGRLAGIERKAKAVALVDSLFQQEQRALADRFSRPLAEKIDGYLHSLFGRDAQAIVSFEDNSFKSIELVRSADAGATSFASLSGGTREQVAAAVRLAIAELLAEDHDGSLPVVFDDAFAYSDPERVNTLQRMLDRGAANGLQIIVLTCNPSDYAALGAKQVALP